LIDHQAIKNPGGIQSAGFFIGLRVFAK